MKQSLIYRGSSSCSSRPANTSVLAKACLIILTLLLGACGSSDDSSGGCDLGLAIFTLGIGCIAQDLGVPVTYGSGSSGNSSPTTTAPPPQPPTAPPPSVGSAEDSPLISFEAFDVEPNDDLATASAASFPSPLVPEQSVGFLVEGTINNRPYGADSYDVVDTYAFTAARSRTFVFQLCSFRSSCNPLTLGGSIDVATAYFSVIDQSGSVLLSSRGNNVSGNVQHLNIDAGVLYYVKVTVENTVLEEQEYTLRVFEALTEPAPELLQKPNTAAPVLMIPDAPPVGLLVSLDWIPPTENENGTPVLDLAGYIVYFGSLSGIYTDFRALDNPGLVTYVLDLPSSGEWFVAVTAINSAGNESDFSNEVAVNVICECDLPPGDMP
jgi:hypothetical protein